MASQASHINAAASMTIAAALARASEVVHGLATLFEHLQKEGEWTRQLAYTVSDAEYRAIVGHREAAFESLSGLAVNLLLGPVAESIHRTRDALEGKTASN